jgi:hypothetical protein
MPGSTAAAIQFHLCRVPRFSPHALGVHTYTVGVDDGHGHTASDSTTVDFGTDTQPPALSVTAPSAGEVVPAAHPYVIRWSVSPGAERNHTISARVRSVQNVNAWTKPGVMFREVGSSNANAANEKFVFLLVSPGKGITMQYRAAVGGPTATAGSILAGTAPGWVRLTRSGDTYTGAWSKDGATWTTVGTISVSIASARVTPASRSPATAPPRPPHRSTTFGSSRRDNRFD